MRKNTRRKITDFICAFLIAASVFACVALVTQADFFASSVRWDKEEGVLEIFDAKFALDKELGNRLNVILGVNDTFFADGFSGTLKKAGKWMVDYSADVVGLLFGAVKEVVGG